MSDKEKCLSVGKNFSRREWLMLIVILLLAEAGALIASHSFMTNQDVLNYISFASTIASLLLAILAIVYGFYQSESQKRAGDGVEMHLSHLRATADQIRAVSSTLSENSSGVTELSTSLKNLNDALHVTQNKLSAVEGSVNGFAKQQESFGASLKEIRGDSVFASAASRDAISGPIVDEVAKVVLGQNAALHIKVIAISILFAFENKDDVKIEIEKIAKKIIDIVLEEDLQDWSSEVWSGAVINSVAVLISIGLLKPVNDEDGFVRFFMVNSEKNYILVEVAEVLWRNPKRVELLGKLKKSMQELSPEKSPS